MRRRMEAERARWNASPPLQRSSSGAECFLFSTVSVARVGRVEEGQGMLRRTELVCGAWARIDAVSVCFVLLLRLLGLCLLGLLLFPPCRPGLSSKARCCCYQAARDCVPRTYRPPFSDAQKHMRASFGDNLKSTCQCQPRPIARGHVWFCHLWIPTNAVLPSPRLDLSSVGRGCGGSSSHDPLSHSTFRPDGISPNLPIEG